MRILELLSSPVWTGPAEPMASVARQLAERGHAVEMAVDNRREGDLRDRLASMGFTVRRDLALCTKSGPLTMAHDCFRLRSIAAGFDLVHAHFSHDQALAVLALCGRRDQRLVRTVHSSRAFGVMRGPVHRRTDGLITICEKHAEILRGRFRIAPERVAVVPGAVDASFFTPDGPNLRRELEIAPETPVAGIVSRVKPGRGHVELLGAFSEVARQMPEARLLIVGRGEGLPAIRAHVDRLGLERQVVFAGYRSGLDLAAAYRTLNVKILMAEGNDGTCRALLEAMACGRPAVSLDFGAPAETIVDGVTGRLVALSKDGAPEREGLAAAILDLLSSPERARAMGKAGRDRVLSHYTERGRGEAVESFLSTILRLPPV